MESLVDIGTYVPRDLNDMTKVFYPFVNRLVARYNKVPANHDDVLQHVFLELCRVDVVTKYAMSHTGIPAKLSGEQAAAYLGMTFTAFKQAVKSATLGDLPNPFRGYTKAQKFEVFERDHGVCYRCGTDMGARSDALQLLKDKNRAKYNELRIKMEENEGIGRKVQILWGIERSKPGKSLACLRTICLCCLYRKREEGGGVRRKIGLAPAPVEGLYSSKSAQYAREDIERFRVAREAKGIKPSEKAEKLVLGKRSSFKLYLATAVANIYKNWCRTRSRRYKEIYKAPLEDGQAWESFQEDLNLIRPENLIEINEQVDRDVSKFVADLKKRRNSSHINEAEVVQLISQGHSLSEVTKLLSAPKVTLRARVG